MELDLAILAGDAWCRKASVLRLLDVWAAGSRHFPSATDAGSAVVSDNQSKSLKRLKFSQDGSFAWAVPT